ncbi:MAG: LysR substrate-binding domain-containing protein, partial [Ktedonobacterales bacterium]
FSQRYPAVEITLSEANSDHLIAALQDGHLDLALIGLAGTPPLGIETEVLADEALVAAVTPSDPLAASDTITLAALQERPLISLPQGTGLRAALDDACAAIGLHPRIALEASSPGVLAQLAARGLGIAILPESTARAHPNLHTLAITHPCLRSRIEFAWRAEGPISPAARALIHHTRTLLAGASADALPAALSLPLPRRQRAGSS